MSDENNINDINDENGDFETTEITESAEPKITRLKGMYQDWFLDYASYVILERAVPHVYDGLKPVHRRILHAMKQLDDGRYNKVANIIGHTMQYHPHGDQSIGDALVQIGQKDLLVDCQGNWGNIFTGDSAAASRYIEARLTKFALEVVFNPKTTFWKSSYDGRNKEPITLPVKFPLLLTMGVEGIAVGLASKILPHNFNELIDACINTLKDEPFEIYPDFPTGGMAEFSRYNDGMRSGRVRVRAKIEKIDKRTLAIREIVFGETTSSIIDSIISANEKGKIKIRKIDDNTAEHVEILIYLPPGVSIDKTIDALYAFTKCEVSLSTYACVIEDDKPRFIGVSEILQLSVSNTVELLRQELLIEKSELEEAWHNQSLEKWFIEQRIYKEKAYENSKTTDEAIDFIHAKAIEHKLKTVREINRDDLLRLLEIRMKRILKFNSDKAEADLNQILEEIAKIQNHLENLTSYAINYYLNIKKKYGQGRERKTEIRNFDTIDTTKVAVANEKLYANLKEGFVGYGIKKEEYICECSDIDDVIVFRRDGKYIVSKVADKAFFGKDILHVDVFKRNDKRTIYNVVYRHGRTSTSYIKRFNVTSVTRDKEYDLTKGEDGSRVLYFTANPNGEAEIVKVFLKPKPKLRKLILEQDFADVAIKGRNAQGNILTKNDIHKLSLKEEGVSTLGGRKIWFDEEVLRLNADNRGRFLGEFSGDDKILVVTKDGVCRLTNFDLSNHYEENIKILEKYKADKVFTAIHYDSEQEFFYLKRFIIEDAIKEQIFIGETEGSYLVDISDDEFPQLKLIFGGKHVEREEELIDAEEFIAIKGLKARGKRITTFETKEIIFIEPLEKETENSDNEDDEGIDDDNEQEVEDQTEISDNVIELEISEPQDKDADVKENKEIKTKEESDIPKTKEKGVEEKQDIQKNKKDKGKKPPPDDTQMSLGF
ncbi:MAG: DNA gyrase/topoisomerase IV subunit A [Bacteroidales bacterium]|nr:DNA gyrase/topoisomerase IV subunit A [Bacteroidales bacterium]MDD4216437.1 DNA gyrase/topoisomerase IV subunit A [Bacteroidales bacterium]